jgi:hypothetical protein
MILSVDDEAWDMSRLERTNIPEAHAEFRDLRDRGFVAAGRFNRKLVPDSE